MANASERASVGQTPQFRAILTDDPIEKAILFGLLAGLAWAPFWLGGDRPLPMGLNGIWFPLLVIVYELSILARGRRHPYAIKRLSAPLALFLLSIVWMIAQTLTILALPTIVHPIWKMAADILDALVYSSVSVNRGATVLAMMRLLTDASVFWLALQLCRDMRNARILIHAVVAFVAVYSIYGLILAAFFSNSIPFFAAQENGMVRSTFVNRNNFATYAGIGFLATVALLMAEYRSTTFQSNAGIGQRIKMLLENSGFKSWYLLGAGLVILAALIGTVSRGGIIATAIGLFALFVLTFTRRGSRRMEEIEIILFVTIAAVAAFLLFGDRIVGRIATSGLEDSSRAAVYSIVARSIMDAPLFGFGYGTFADVFPMYRDGSVGTSGIWDMAHNTYLEVWQGLGLVFGTALMGSLFIIAAQCFLGAIRRRRDSTPAIVASVTSLLVGIHAIVDFSLQIEAVTLTFMSLLGAGLSQSVSSRDYVED